MLEGVRVYLVSVSEFYRVTALALLCFGVACIVALIVACFSSMGRPWLLQMDDLARNGGDECRYAT